MVICDGQFYTKDDQILQNSSQEPSMSSKYDCFLDVLIIMLGSWKCEYNSGMTNYVDSWCQIWYQRGSNPPKLQLETINLHQVWPCSWCTLNHTRELKIGIKLNNDIWWLFLMSNLIPNMTKSIKSPVMNHQHPPSMTVFLMHLYLF